MAKLNTIVLTGRSGAQYEFNVYPRSDQFLPIGAVYCMSKRTIRPDGVGSHEFVYIGETGDLSKRPLNHHCSSCFDSHGANALLILAESDHGRRLKIETDLRQAYDPVCNKQSVSDAPFGWSLGRS